MHYLGTDDGFNGKKKAPTNKFSTFLNFEDL